MLPPRSVRRFLSIWYVCVLRLHTWGERAWPWNVRVMWPEARKDVLDLLPYLRSRRERRQDRT